jgi:hypothetical protein
MLGRRSDWFRWLLVLGALMIGIRGAVWLALPLLPDAFAWGSAAMLGAALTFFLLPLPHEKTLARRPDPAPNPDERRERGA